ncbi:ABC transporter ATP-binding protein [Schinkia azotoformans]|uniref:Xenobiotic-transporting ATPase n=1 Tax=Schinkia azotoformans LMG 9581 TaxID=1131731 RepID=K6D799_SCHAZ|nr:ABC transporter ATP-binding protein [Schinkia azotoformans]EKN64169.1 Xenobiotic-transporting ATPase [Schinkia azotoformans LMG 9581]MEC1639572.1 ABC transporter ATP-binding protein [Schinkia azotoformans]MEC1722260.1 ABC transporter ATP-binding protein [Schinkia azotoformans]MEC1944684.1 ABC transporter ATP-binding protein [Schinkia azotoformans]MED4352043.1 ABC transporter ATP-binding protein [Schinkia azotoformans]
MRLLEILAKLKVLFDHKDKKKFGLLLFLMIIAGVLETIGIGFIVPFIGAVTTPEIITENVILNYLYRVLQLTSTTSFIIVFAIVLAIVYLLKNIYLILFYSFQYKLLYDNQVKMSRHLFETYLKKPYSFQLQTNSSEMLRNINIDVERLFNGVLTPVFLLISESIISCGIICLLLFIAPLPTLSLAILLTISITLFLRVFRKKMELKGRVVQQATGQMIKWINQGLGAIKDVKVNGKERYFLDQFTLHSTLFVKESRYIRVLNHIPRMFIETIVVVIILLVIVMLLLMNGQNMYALLTTMALFAMAAFRLMPSANKIVGALSSIRYHYSALEAIYQDLNSTVERCLTGDSTEINSFHEKWFSQEINLENISFSYIQTGIPCINGISLTIPVGQSIAIIGKSGSGKTTLVDLMLGLYQPDQGNIYIDGKSLKDVLPIWKRKVGYIPQTIYLSDDTILRNVAFGIEDRFIDREQVWKVLEVAQLKEFVQQLPDQLETSIGEQGVRLSGGQRQRIGIARALYHNPEILFMDEATSALDNETEKEIITAVDQLKGEKTLIIIAHRLTTIENCDIVIEIEEGRVKKVSRRKMTENVI